MVIPVATDLTFDLSSNSNGTKIHSKINWDNTSIKHFKDNLFKENKIESIEQCVDLLEHIGSCYDWKCCNEGEGCHKTKQVLAHYYNCPKTVLGWDCPICQQFQALCQIHKMHCKNSKADCNVPFCANKSLQKLQLENKNDLKVGVFIKEKNNARLVKVELLKALQTKSATGKEQKVLELLKSHPAVTVNFLKQLHKWKFDKLGFAQGVVKGSNQQKTAGSLNPVEGLGCQVPVKVQAKVLIKAMSLHH